MLKRRERRAPMLGAIDNIRLMAVPYIGILAIFRAFWFSSLHPAGMKPRMPKLFVFALSALSFMPLTSWAGPLRSSDVPENVAWFAHVDCDALRDNALGKFMLAEMNKPDNQSKLAVVTAIIDVDFRTQIHGLTLYAQTDFPKQPVLIVYGEFDTNRLITLAKGANEYESTQHEQHTIHSWLDQKRKMPDGSPAHVYAALPGTNMIIFGPREKAVADVLDVLDNKAANLSNNKSYSQILKSSEPGTFLQAVGRKLDLPPAAADLASHARLQVRESNEELIAQFGIGSRSEAVATNMLSIAQGITGLIKLQEKRPAVAKLAEKATLKQDGAEVLLTIVAPSEQVIEMLKFVLAKKLGAH